MFSYERRCSTLGVFSQTSQCSHRQTRCSKRPLLPLKSPQPSRSLQVTGLHIPPFPCSLMSDAFWPHACRNAEGRPLQTVLDAAHASCGVMVRRAPAPAAILRCVLLRADGVRQLLRCCDVGGKDDAVNERIQRQRCCFESRYGSS
jgi:hypothetical protein